MLVRVFDLDWFCVTIIEQTEFEISRVFTAVWRRRVKFKINAEGVKWGRDVTYPATLGDFADNFDVSSALRIIIEMVSPPENRIKSLWSS